MLIYLLLILFKLLLLLLWSFRSRALSWAVFNFFDLGRPSFGLHHGLPFLVDSMAFFIDLVQLLLHLVSVESVPMRQLTSAAHRKRDWVWSACGRNYGRRGHRRLIFLLLWREHLDRALKAHNHIFLDCIDPLVHIIDLLVKPLLHFLKVVKNWCRNCFPL